MIRFALSFSGIFLFSIFAFAKPADLVGSWGTDCINSEIDVLTFEKDGNGVIGSRFYIDRLCKSSFTEINSPLRYQATDKELMATYEGDPDSVFVLRANYVLKGNQLTVTGIEGWVNGEPQKVDTAPQVLSRVN